MELTNTILGKQIQSWIPTTKDDDMSDKIIDAYRSGKKDGMEQQEKLLNKNLKENINKSGKISLDLFKTLKENKFTPVDAYLRVDSWDRIEVMITIHEKDYIKEEFLDMFDIVSEIEENSKEDFFSISITFCSINDNFDEEYVSSDGYIFKLGVK